MADISALAGATTGANALSNLILVTPSKSGSYQPQNPDGPESLPSAPPILFHYEGEQSIILQTDITDHFTESNIAIQDNISIKPVTITVHGYIAELNDIAPKALQPLKTVAEKLTVISAYTPALSTTALIAYNEAAFLYSTAQKTKNAAVAAWSSIRGGSGSALQTKQQLAFNQFYGYLNSRTLFTVQTPWAKFENMAILTLRAIQDADTRVITDFEVTFKQIQFANTITTFDSQQVTIGDFGNNRGRAQNQKTVKKGPTSLTLSADFASSIAGGA